MEPFAQQLPLTVSGWEVLEADESYDRSTLHEYINGGAELYLAYDFQRVFARRYQRMDYPEIVVDIYDMGSDADAYGVFSVERQDEACGIGADSEYGGGLLRFRQDRYFVTILAIGDDRDAKAVILELGKKVSALIPDMGRKPELLQYLPPENLLRHGVRFFHTHTILNRQYFLDTENILLLDRHSDCVFAPYQDGENRMYLLLVRYPDAGTADSAYHSFRNNYLSDSRSDIAELENGKWVMVKRQGRHLAAVFDAATAESAKALLSRVEFCQNNPNR